MKAVKIKLAQPKSKDKAHLATISFIIHPVCNEIREKECQVLVLSLLSKFRATMITVGVGT